MPLTALCKLTETDVPGLEMSSFELLFCLLTPANATVVIRSVCLSVCLSVCARVCPVCALTLESLDLETSFWYAGYL